MKKKYRLPLSMKYKTGDILTYDLEFGEQVIVMEPPVDHVHEVTNISINEEEGLDLNNWVKGTEITKVSFAGKFGEYTTQIYYPEGYVGECHGENQETCILTTDATEIRNGN